MDRSPLISDKHTSSQVTKKQISANPMSANITSAQRRQSDNHSRERLSGNSNAMAQYNSSQSRRQQQATDT